MFYYHRTCVCGTCVVVRTVLRKGPIAIGLVTVNQTVVLGFWSLTQTCRKGSTFYVFYLCLCARLLRLGPGGSDSLRRKCSAVTVLVSADQTVAACRGGSHSPAGEVPSARNVCLRTRLLFFGPCRSDSLFFQKVPQSQGYMPKFPVRTLVNTL